MINASGYKVWPAEVESHLCAHPSVLQACVIGCRHPLRGESVKALVVLRPGRALVAAELIAWSRDRMAAYKTPQLVEFMDALPMNAAGKIEWRRLEERELTLTPSTPPPSTVIREMPRCRGSHRRSSPLKPSSTPASRSYSVILCWALGACSAFGH